jgi:ribonuclease Z
MIRIVFLGTGAGSPSLSRWALSTAIVYDSLIGLLDCGEGCQIRLQQRGISPLKIRFVAVTHLHGDHVIGLLPLLQTMTLFNRKDVLEIIGPKDLKDLVELFMKISRHKTSFNIIHKDPLEKISYNDKIFIKGFETCHTIESYGYLIEIKYKKDLFKICFTGDTGPCENVVMNCKDVDILIHDATFLSEHRDEASASGHSTVEDAAKTALEANVKKLYLTHISSRYNDEKKILGEAKKVFKESYLANDLDEIIIF